MGNYGQSIKTINQTNNSGGVEYIVENLIQDNKEITDKLIQTQQKEIEFLRNLLATKIN